MIISYIRDRRWCIISYAVTALVFASLTYLYGLPMRGILYAAALSPCLLSPFAVSGYIKYKRKHTAINQASCISPCDLSLLPAADGLIEKDYQLTADSLQAEITRQATEKALADTEMNDFYALWVHQIKTPIAAISLMLQEDGREKNKALAGELFKIERYTELVLNYLRLEDISGDLITESCSLEAIVNSAVKKYSPVFIQKKITLSLDGLERRVITDDKWLCFALEQLLSNALKYTDCRGSISIYATDGDTLVIRDSGIGISKEDLPRIFEKGFTGFNGRMDKKATGLGLYLTKKTLDKLGHGISFSSDAGRGTKVEIDLSRRKTVYE